MDYYQNNNTSAVTEEPGILTRDELFQRFKLVREFSEILCKPLVTEDYVIQSMPDVSPAKWHLAHTSWFFEAFILNKVIKNYKSLHPHYHFLFNSYYIQAGERWTRAMRGLLSRPTVADVYAYREYVTLNIIELLNKCSEDELNELAPVLEIGINHEQQHQELILTDIKHVFSINPLIPLYIEKPRTSVKSVPKIKWIEFEGGVKEIGHDGNGFAYDNESPRHKVYLEPFRLASRLVTNGEYMEFINDRGYQRPELWLSDGYAAVENEKWTAPLYWKKENNNWWNFTLTGKHLVDPNEPVCHISYYEADAYARWMDARLPSEAEWETAAAGLPLAGNFVDVGNFHPVPAAAPEGDNGKTLKQIYGDVWEWTASSYSPYPGFKTLPGALGEYNGKFMSGQMVLRGGSCATSRNHIRRSYRNFFPPNARWQFSGLRLAKEN